MKKSETKTTTSAPSAGNGAAAAAQAASSAAEHEPTKAELEAEFDPNDKGMYDFRNKFLFLLFIKLYNTILLEYLFFYYFFFIFFFFFV